MKKGKLNPVFIIIACFFIFLRCLDLMSATGRLLQTGGRASIEELVEGYQDAINAGDAKAYLKLIPRSERTREEKQHIKEKIDEYSGNDYEMKVESTDTRTFKSIISDNAKFVLLDPVFCPIISEKDSVKVSIKKGDEYYYEMITVYKIYGKYYLDDMDVY